MSKLTLSVDEAVIKRAKIHARKSGVSISRMFEQYLEAITSPSVSTHTAKYPLLSELKGSLKGVSPDAHKKYLEAKYL